MKNKDTYLWTILLIALGLFAGFVYLMIDLINKFKEILRNYK